MAYFDHSTWLKHQGGGGYRHRNDPHHRNDLPHRNDPNQHRNDTGGHHQNDPRNIGNGIRGLQKLDNNLVGAFYLFILHLFYGVYFSF